eukprot:COSAG02_NODE_11911_length_1631_cov_2.161227_1_plen_72_part_00
MRAAGGGLSIYRGRDESAESLRPRGEAESDYGSTRCEGIAPRWCSCNTSTRERVRRHETGFVPTATHAFKH